MSRLYERLLIQRLVDEVLVDLRKGAVEHLTSLKHVENAVRED